MKIKALLFILSLVTFISCDFSKSVNKDLITGLTTKGDGLSCENVYLSDGESKIKRTEFIYGEKFFLNFSNIQGFKKEGEFAYPGMQLIVLNKEKDTILLEDDLFKNESAGFDVSPLLLSSNLITASPIRSNKEYELKVNIWDKKGEGTFKAKMDFTVVPNDKIQIENNNLTYDEIYLYSQVHGKIIIDNNVSLNEKIYLVFDGLKGLTLMDEKVFLGMTIKATDSNGQSLLITEDLFEDIGYDPAEVKKMLTAEVVFTGEGINNPVTCEIEV